MLFLALLFAALTGLNSLKITTVTGKTPSPPPCLASYCENKKDGNYHIDGYPNDFVQCSNGIAYCQSCWPHNLFFSEKCNQCLYKRDQECYTTQPWEPHSTYDCPDLCPGRNGANGEPKSGNIEDPENPYHYVACWKGKTVACMVCPSGLKYSESWDYCYGEHEENHTEPTE